MEDDESARSAGAPTRGRRRLLTAVYYVNHGWDTSTSGGALRLWADATAGGPDGAPPYRDVEPVADRLLLFWSNRSHEVQPVHAAHASRPRCAFTQWFSLVV